MLSTQHLIKVVMPKDIFNNYGLNKIIFFDIETTGFDKVKNNVVLISCGYFIEKDRFCVNQYFAENLQEEREILEAFGKDLADFNSWCSYNGKAFDEPFIKRRMEINNIEFYLPKEHVDLYRKIRPYHKQLGMDRCNLKSVEKFLGINRDDTIDGGISVELYFEYLRTRDSRLVDVIMLHNYEDVLNLPEIFRIVHKIDKSKDLKREDCITEKQLKYLKYLLKKNNINIDCDVNRVSKKAASRAIHYILNEDIDQTKVKKIMESSY